MRVLGAVWLVSVGCTDKTTTDETTPTTDSGTTDSGTTDTDTDPIGPTGPVASIQGVVSLGGAPLAEADARLCRGTACRYATSDANGQYSFVDVPLAAYSLEIVKSDGYATVFAPVELAAEEVRTIDLVTFPYDSVAPISTTEQSFEVGTGLRMTLSADGIEPVQLLAEDPTEVGGVRVPMEAWPPIEGVSGTVFGVWYVDPFDFASVDPGGLPVQFDNEWALAEGTTLDVFVGSYNDSAWLPGGAATVSAGGATLDGAAIPLISTVILVQP